MPYISVSHSLKIDLSAHSFSERFTENRILLLHFQWIHSLKIDSSAQSFNEPFTENSFYVKDDGTARYGRASRRPNYCPVACPVVLTTDWAAVATAPPVIRHGPRGEAGRPCRRNWRQVRALMTARESHPGQYISIVTPVDRHLLSVQADRLDTSASAISFFLLY